MHRALTVLAVKHPECLSVAPVVAGRRHIRTRRQVRATLRRDVRKGNASARIHRSYNGQIATVSSRIHWDDNHSQVCVRVEPAVPRSRTKPEVTVISHHHSHRETPAGVLRSSTGGVATASSGSRRDDNSGEQDRRNVFQYTRVRRYGAR